MSRLLHPIALLTAMSMTAPALAVQNTKTTALPQQAKPVGKQAIPYRPLAKQPQQPHPEPETLAPAEPRPNWTGNGELGYASAHGNSSTESFNGRLNMKYADGFWAHSFDLFGLRATGEFSRTNDDGSTQLERRTTANRYTFNGNSAYLMDARGTINTSLRHEQDDFGTYSRQQSLSLSYGNRVIDGEKTQLDLQIGPGYRRTHHRLDDEEQASPIARGRIGLKYAMSENTELVNTLLVESGDYNTFAQNDLGISVAMNSHLALKAGWQARHNSNVDENRKKTDTLTTMNVVYKFK